MVASRPLIDENGSLFGIVNIVDAAVIVLLCCVLVAGGLLVVGETTSEPEPTRYATISYTAPLQSDGVTVDPGTPVDLLPTGDPVTAVDVVRSFTPEGTAHLAVRVRYSGDLSAGRIRADGIYVDDVAPRFGGDEVRVLARSYRTDGEILSVNQTRQTLTTRNVSVLVDVNQTVARATEPGTVTSIDTQTVARVQNVTADDGGSLVRLQLRAWYRDDTAYFGGRALRVTNHVTVVTDEAVVSGQIQQVELSDGSVDGNSDDES